MAHAIAHIPAMQSSAQELRANLLGQNAELQAAGQAFCERLTELHGLQRMQTALHSCSEVRIEGQLRATLQMCRGHAVKQPASS